MPAARYRGLKRLRRPEFGVKASVMSLVIARVVVPDFVESAWLLAVTCTVSGDGMSHIGTTARRKFLR